MLQKENKKIKYWKKKIIIFLGVFVFFIFFLLNFKNIVEAQEINVFDYETHLWVQDVQETIDRVAATEKGEREEKAKEQSIWSKLFHTTLGKALNTLAYDTATWIGSGGEGQKPMFITEGWGAYLTNIADSAAGNFLETLGQENDWGVKFNLCTPDLNIKLKIGLGLREQVRPTKPPCTFSEMAKNWDQAIQKKDFLPKFQDMFNPTSNNLGAALTLSTQMIETTQKEKDAKEKDRTETKGWLDVRDRISGVRESYPGFAEEAIKEKQQLTGQNIAMYTGDALMDALNIFINQLAVTLFENLMKQLAKGADSFTSPYDWDRLTSFEAGPAPVGGGVAGAKDKLRKIIQPNFSSRGDYNILAELIQCPDPNKAGPTNCVITDKFSQAVSQKLTVGEALKQGYLNSNGTFGFMADGLEPDYNAGYPYRSMIILRKFRIIPVGWEVAAQYVKKNQGTLRGAKSLSDLIACFDSEDDYAGYFDNWCKGLVDPTWVLKAPQNFCKRQGPGPEIMSEQISGEKENSKLTISRNENYCADEQSCLKEKDDGSCDGVYGYCTEEKRKWRFNDGKICDPNYNTCETFRSRKGKTFSYLENTLDYSGCSINNVGCKWYCDSFDYLQNKWMCDSDNGNKLYFNKNAETCKSEDEGCHEFIRTKPGIGANLLPNSSFELDADSAAFADSSKDDGLPDNFYFWGNIGSSVKSSYDGLTGLNPSGDIDKLITVGPDDFSIGGEIYTLSFYAKDCGSAGTITLASSMAKFETTSNWQQFKLTAIVPIAAADNHINIKIEGFAPACVIDAIKLERGMGTNYNDYRGSGLVYEKYLPFYLYDSCYSGAKWGDYTLKANVPAECFNFARKCNSFEVGCELYASEDGGQIPAKVIAQDYCPDECVGYDTFVQKESVFDTLRDSYFIPSTAKSCSAEQRGCDEFTNLDAVEKGGEAKEYYTYLKQCMKPSPADCSEFYTWEGSDEAGYQLKVFSLKKDGDKPYVTNNGPYNDKFCDKQNYNLSTNPDCREFYNTQGGVSYKFLPYTITCSDNCKPYRRTENNIEPNILEKANCGIGANLGKSCTDAAFNGDPNIAANAECWDDAQEVCYLCKNGGAWDAQSFACMYNAIPGEGNKCSASQNGCREYTGNSGNNTMIIMSNNFEGSVQGWIGIGGTSVAPSSNALMVNGNSLYISGGDHEASTTVGQLVSRGNSYVLSFIAQGENSNVDLTAYFDSGTASASFQGTIGINLGEWRSYQINLPELNHDVSAGESFVIKGTGNFYIDDIKLTEISDRYYLIKNSWVTPAACYNDIFGNLVGPFYNLGCSRYHDRDNNIHNLHSFNRLCQDSAVGCELMIDTNNSTEIGESIVNDDGAGINSNNQICDADEPDCVKTSADNYIYAVFDKKKECNQSEKGCRRLGDYYKYENSFLFSDAYLKNDPDKYNSILCDTGSVGCEEWATGGGTSYFKDPGDQICEWRQEFGKANSVFKWYKKRQKRCDDGSGGGTVNGEIDLDKTINPFTAKEKNICVSDSDCSLVSDYASCKKDADCNLPSATSKTFYNSCVSGRCRYSCVEEAMDNPCPIRADKTFGYGGQGKQVEQPTGDNFGYWAGTCSASQAGCSEYVDPKSQFAVNLVFNGDFTQDIDHGTPNADGWSAAGTQDVGLEPNTLYALRVQGINAVSVSVPAGRGSIMELMSDTNSLDVGRQLLAINSVSNDYTSALFYTSDSISGAYVTAGNALPGINSKVELKKVVVDYQIKGNIDKTSCSGVYNFEDGCVLFNERVMDGSSLSKLVYDADRTAGKSSPFKTDPADAADKSEDSNVLIKVAPDRVCDKWLACRSMAVTKRENGEKINSCFDVGLCNSLDKNDNCNNFVITPDPNNKVELQANLPGDFSPFSNSAGYVKVGLNGVNDNTMRGDYPFGQMAQEGEVAFLPNGNFEEYSSDGYPVGWTPDSGIQWSASAFKIINNPYEAQQEGIGYAREGKSFIKMGVVSAATSEYANVLGNTTYTVTSYVNSINLNGGFARLKIQQFSGSGTLVAENPIVSYAGGNDWGYQVNTFTANNITTAVKVVLYTDAGARGNYYFDDIKIRPSLLTRSGWRNPQSCRLYPESGSLSCDYFDDSSIRRKGWWGYCLEYDRYPGSPNSCLLWWPADKVKSDGIEEGAGYNDRLPVYYSISSATNNTTYDPQKTVDVVYSFKETPKFLNKADLGIDASGCMMVNGYYVCLNRDNIINITTDDVDPGHNGAIPFDINAGNGWTVQGGIDGQHQCRMTANFDANNILDNLRLERLTDCDNDESHPCRFAPKINVKYNFVSEIAMVVTPAGQNKYWSGRVYSGSNYSISCNTGFPYPIQTCGYGTDYNPFGSIYYPSDVGPELWDGNSNVDGYQPLRYLPNSTEPRAGQIYTKDQVKLLFAQSYGTWTWNGNNYVKGNDDWGPPTAICPGARGAADYCAILPQVSNIKVNDSAADVLAAGTQFINLTFNSILDSQQMPLVAYKIDWGDGEETSVSGVEMRPMSNADNPHSVYHLYSYWDLKSKANKGVAGIDCNNAAYPGACVIKPRVRIKDNWGWCNRGAAINVCGDAQFDSFGGLIVVYEK